jgi:uncharacterized protein YbjT (DUF2867 family)
MKIILFGATGMVGQGVLRECLADPQVTAILALVRQSLGQNHPKLREIVHKDFTNFTSLEKELTGYDACFFCLGVSSVGMNEAAYRKLTYDLTLAAAQTLVKCNSGMTFIYVSGQGTDSTEKGKVMWARVKGATEHALFQLPFKAAYMFRPGYIQPLDGVVTKVKIYRAFYAVLGPLYPLLKRLFPKHVTSTRQVGLAMIRVVRQGYGKKILGNHEINEIGS